MWLADQNKEGREELEEWPRLFKMLSNDIKARHNLIVSISSQKLGEEMALSKGEW